MFEFLGFQEDQMDFLSRKLIENYYQNFQGKPLNIANTKVIKYCSSDSQLDITKVSFP